MSQPPSFRPATTTIADVAQAAGVSRMTVSKVLRGTGRISAETSARVKRLADELGYIPNGLAGALSSQKSTLIGIMIPSIGEEVYSGVLAGINAVIHPKGFSGLIGETFFDPEIEERLVRMMLSMKPAGLVLTGGLHRKEATKRLLNQGGVRSVQLWDGDQPGLDATIGVSHHGAGRMAADAFLSAGIKRCAYVGAELARDLCAAMRRQGFADRLTESGANCRLVADPALPRNAESGFMLTQRLLARRSPPEAIHYLNDAMAIGGLRCLSEAGIDVPGRVSVIGFNGTSLRYGIRTRLTTIEVPLRLVGERAAEAVIHRREEREGARIELLPMRLVHGTTCRKPTS